MYCEKCGKTVQDGLTVCPECGTQLTQGAAYPADPEAQAKFVSYMEQNRPTPQQTDFIMPPQPAKKKKGPLVGVIAAAAVLVVAFVGGFLAYPSVLRSVSPTGYVEYAQNKSNKAIAKEIAVLNKALGGSTAEKILSGNSTEKFSLDFEDLVTGSADVDEVLKTIKLELSATQDKASKKASANAKLEAMGVSSDVDFFMDENSMVMELPEALGIGKIKLDDNGIAEKWNNSSMADAFGEMDEDIDFADFFKDVSGAVEKNAELIKNISEKSADLMKNHSKTENGGKQYVEALGGDYYDMIITAEAEAWTEGIKEILKEIYSEDNLNGMMPMMGDTIGELHKMIDEIAIESLVIHAYADSKNRSVGCLMELEADTGSKVNFGFYFCGKEKLTDNIVIEIGTDDDDNTRIEIENNNDSASGVFNTEIAVTVNDYYGETTVSFEINWDSKKPEDNLTFTMNITEGDEDSGSIKLTGNYFADSDAQTVSFSLTGIDAEMYGESFSYKWNLTYELSPAKDGDLKEISADGAKDLFDEDIAETLGEGLNQLVMGFTMGGNDYDEYPDDLEGLEDYEDFDWEDYEDLEDLEL